MRQYEKKQLIKMTELLDTVHVQIAQLYAQGNHENACEIMIQAIEVADTMRVTIENNQGKVDVASGILNYRTELLSLLEEIAETSGTEQEISSADMQDRLWQLGQSLQVAAERIKNDLPVRYEVVFLPYKVGMWDSLESIYLAAKEDPECDPYVVPIPYYDKNSDDSFGRLNYEGDRFPSDIPVMPFTRYNLEERHPDAIFIHNAYDDVSFVTSVKEEYYTKRLSQYTDCLVYVPYYVFMGGVPEWARDLPGYYNVDYIVTESEEHSSQMDKFHKDKYLPFGSPKYDKVINYRVREEDIPEEWKPKLYDKAVFMNASLTAVLTYGEAMLAKLRAAAKLFRMRGDITLLFRPHPLIESTLEMMRPELLHEYMDIVRMIEEMPCGIVDRTPIPELAIALSNAYIGESKSSIPPLFRAAGKPIFYFNYDIETVISDVNDYPYAEPKQRTFSSQEDTGSSPRIAQGHMANADGRCGEKVYAFVKSHISLR